MHNLVESISTNLSQKFFLIILVLVLIPKTSLASLIFINEIHYDNIGQDANEFIEIAGPENTSLNDWQILLYNGSNNSVYKTIDIENVTLVNSGNGYGFHQFLVPSIQNGAPDGIALVDTNGLLQQFISYEGTMTIDWGVEKITSEMLNVSQTNNTANGLSLQLQGEGLNYGDFSWVLAKSSAGQVNNCQSFGTAINNCSAQANEPAIFWLFFLSMLLLVNRKQHKQSPFAVKFPSY